MFKIYTDRHAYIRQQELMDKKEVQGEALNKAESRGMKAKRQTQPCQSSSVLFCDSGSLNPVLRLQFATKISVTKQGGV